MGAGLGLMGLAGRGRHITVPQGIIAYWPLDDVTISGTTVSDVSANGHNGTNTGSTKPSSTTGQINQGLLFDGSTGWINIQSLALSVFPFAISAWFKTSNSSATFRSIAVAAISTGTTELYNLALSSSHFVQWQARGNNVDAIAIGSATKNDGNWHHALGVSRGAADHQLFIDGASVATNTTSVSAPQATQASIGSQNRSSNGSFFPGSIDDVRFYNRAITTAEALAIYTAGLSGRP